MKRLLSVGLVPCLLALLLGLRPGDIRADTPSPSPSLSQRIHRARPGSRLTLSPGTFRGPLVVDKPLTLVGAGPERTRIRGTDTGSVVVVRSDSVVLKNLSVAGDGGVLKRDDAAVFVENARGVTVSRCRIRARGFGIYLHAGGNHRILHNTVVGTRSRRRSERGNGIHLWKTTNNRLLGNRIRYARDGIYLSFAHQNRLEGNRGRRLRYGIHYMYSEQNRLNENRFEGNVGGIALMYSRNNRITNNHSHHNDDFGILLLQLENSRLTENVLRGNKRGLFVQNSVTNTLLRNRLYRNHTGIHLSAGSTRNVIAHNSFTRNNVHVYRHMSRGNRWTRDGRGNYWEGYPGVDLDGDGIGDRPRPLESPAGDWLATRPDLALFLNSPLYHLVNYLGRRVQPSFDGLADTAPLTEPVPHDPEP